MVRNRLEGMPSPGNSGIFDRMQGDTGGKRELLPPHLKCLLCNGDQSVMGT